MTNRIISAVLVLLIHTTAIRISAAPELQKDASIYGFPDLLTSINASSKGWIFAPPFMGLKWVELNGILLTGNTGLDDSETGISFDSRPATFALNGFDWTEASQRPARNGISRGGIGGAAEAINLKLAVTPGRKYLLEILTLANKPKRAFNVIINRQLLIKNWTVLADKAANRLLRIQVEAAENKIDLQLTPGNLSGADNAPALSALAITDLTERIAQHDPIFGRVQTGWVNIASLGTGSSPDGMKQDGDGKGSQAAIDGDPSTYWDEEDNARLYRYAVAFNQPEKVSGLAIMGWAQHDFAPKDFEVLCDGKSVKKIENAQYNNNLLQLRINDTTCKSIELKITGYYGRSPAIRELGIFSPEPHSLPVKPAVISVPAEPKDGGPIFAEWPLVYNQKRLLTYALGKFKPYVKEFMAVSGQNILRDAPFDHLHHHSLMYGIRVNGVNFWEEVAGCGYQKPVKTENWIEGKTAAGHPQFTLKQTIHWLAPADADLSDTSKSAILLERRTLVLTISGKEAALHWKGEFEIGPKTNQVSLAGANYHGLGMRFIKEFDPIARHLNAGGAPDLNGKQDVSQHKWGSVFFDQPAKPVTLVLFGHPSNARGNAWFFTMREPFAYLSATQNLDKEPIVYRAGDKWELNYLLTLYPERKSSEEITARSEQWTSSQR